MISLKEQHIARKSNFVVTDIAGQEKTVQGPENTNLQNESSKAGKTEWKVTNVWTLIKLLVCCRNENKGK